MPRCVWGKVIDDIGVFEHVDDHKFIVAFLVYGREGVVPLDVCAHEFEPLAAVFLADAARWQIFDGSDERDDCMEQTNDEAPHVVQVRSKQMCMNVNLNVLECHLHVRRSKETCWNVNPVAHECKLNTRCRWLKSFLHLTDLRHGWDCYTLSESRHFRWKSV